MSLQGHLREFSANDILQLLGTQKKTGCLILESKGMECTIYVTDGRLVATRAPGMSKDDPLLRFLLRAHRLSNEQYRGLLTIQKESNRDLEDLLVNGRYLEAEELGGYIERQLLDELMRVTGWEDGTYAFDANRRWPNPPLARLSVEAALIEVARRTDEEKRFTKEFKDPYQLIGVRDLPDADENLSEEECELFGIIDGRHTVTEIVESAPLTEYEAYESLLRMMEAGWIEVVGRRDPGTPAPPPLAEPAAIDSVRPIPRSARGVVREVAVGLAILVVAAGIVFGTRSLRPSVRPPDDRDAFAATELRDLRYALELYRLEEGRYPEQLDELVAKGWLAPRQLKVGGTIPSYKLWSGEDYRLGNP